MKLYKFTNYINSKGGGELKTFDDEQTIVNMQGCTIEENAFTYNLALISNSVFLQGCTRIYFNSNIMVHNSIPIPEYLEEGIFRNSGYFRNVGPFNFDYKDVENGPFPSGIPGLTYLEEEKKISTTSSPVIFHLTSYVQVVNCIFRKKK